MAKISPENTEETALRHMMTPVLRENLDRALSTLSERRKKIFLAHYIDGISYEELSHRYFITEKRASDIARLARKQLQRITSLRQYLDMLS